RFVTCPPPPAGANPHKPTLFVTRAARPERSRLQPPASLAAEDAERHHCCSHEPPRGATMSTLHPLITIDPGRRGGRACVRGLRISVGDVLGWLARGMSPAEIMADYPELTHADIQACLAYAADREQHEVHLATAT
ncbi:MAG: DUF433 domain-containing protein, partial [Burkholderiaceae bacterium]|nr:DUF433 domain-containing protein [Burkholderiaceae bacterium]